MSRSLADTAHPGAHPTMREFAELLELWGFKPVRGRRADRHHLLLRGPHGGRIHVLASLQGRADADLVARAARLAHVDVENFLAGHPSHEAAPPAERVTSAAAEFGPQPPTATPVPPQFRPRRAKTTRARGDSVVSLVLTAHARHDRPIRFEEIVDLCGGRVTRAQAREASAHLCRTGQLDRICEGVYQWAHGSRRPAGLPTPPQPPTRPQEVVAPPAELPTATKPIDELFARLFPHGIRMTPQLLRDLQQWAELTRALAAHADDPR